MSLDYSFLHLYKGQGVVNSDVTVINVASLQTEILFYT